MAEYFTGKAIAERLNVSGQALRYWTQNFSFPMFKRRRHPGDPQVLYTNDEMILRWQMARAAQHSRERKAKTQARLQQKLARKASRTPEQDAS